MFQIFLIILRALCVECRLVMSLQPITCKPTVRVTIDSMIGYMLYLMLYCISSVYIVNILIGNCEGWED